MGLHRQARTTARSRAASAILTFPFQPISLPTQLSGASAGAGARRAQEKGAQGAFRTVSSHIVGAAQVGRLLKVRVSQGSGTRLAYQWERCPKSGEHCSRIRGATRSSYRVTHSDVGHVVTVAVKASVSSGPALVALSSVTVGKRSEPSPKNVAAPVLSGSGDRRDCLEFDNR